MIYLFLSVAGNYVSLPGAESAADSENGSILEPTILQVINKINVTPAALTEVEGIGKQQQQQVTADTVDDTDATAAAFELKSADSKDKAAAAVDDLAPQQTHLDSSADRNSHITSNIEIKSKTVEADNEREVEASPNVATADSPATVLDIESHLIETLNDYQADENGVGINELAPIQVELTECVSKVETDNNVRTVIEVEPAGTKTKQPIETTLFPHSTATLITETVAAAETEQADIAQAAQQAPTPAIKLETDLFEEQQSDLKTEVEKTKAVTLASELDKEDIAEQLEQTTATAFETDSAAVKTEVAAASAAPEITGILKNSKQHANDISVNLNGIDINLDAEAKPRIGLNELKIVDVPTPNSPLEAEERKLFIESLPQIDTNTDATKLIADCKREYYQSLKKYLIQVNPDKPPVPLQTYRWEDLRRAKERGGYPWTHLYKRPLGPDDEPEIVLLLRKSQELRFASESPKSLKKVRIDEQVLVKETERYIQDLSEDDDESERVLEGDSDKETEEEQDEEDEDEIQQEQVLDEAATAEKAETHSLRSESISCVSDSVLASGAGKPRKTTRLANIRSIIQRRRSGRSAAETQSLPGTSTNVSRQQSQEQIATAESTGEVKKKRGIPIMKKLKSMAERQKKRLNIKRITLKKNEKIVLADETKILKLKASPKAKRDEIPHFIEKQDSDDILEIVDLEESPGRKRREHDDETEADNAIESSTSAAATTAQPVSTTTTVEPDEIIEITSNIAESQATVQYPTEPSVETKEAIVVADAAPKKAPRLRREHVYEEIGHVQSNAGESLSESTQHVDKDAAEKQPEQQTELFAPFAASEETAPAVDEADADSIIDLKPSIKKEASPAPSDKKVTFSHVEDDADPHREDIELPDDIKEATAAAKKLKPVNEHEYEPIGIPTTELAQPTISADVNDSEMTEAEKAQRDLEQHFFTAERTTITSSTAATIANDVPQIAVQGIPCDDEDEHIKPEKKGFMASAQARTRRMQAGFKTQAGKIKTKLRTPNKKVAPTLSESPKPKERKRFTAPEFSKLKMPDIKRPDMTRLKEFKRPEFTKFNKPDMSKFKLPEKFSTLKLRRSKSLKENETPADDEDAEMQADTATTEAPAQKKMFDFSFGTYPRAFRKKKKEAETAQFFDTDTATGTGTGTGTGTEGQSVIPSTETQPSLESSSSPQGDRGPGPVRSRWADKFSDVSYNDSEGSRYRRYGSEQESFDRESSLERRMREDLEDTGSGSETAHDMGILGGVADTKQFAEFDEENRAIHEISNLRAGEFKRRPMVHQDSDLRSEDSKDAVGWTDKEIQKNKLLRKAELEAEASFYKYPADETQSTASSGKKVVMEEIDDDEFFLRKRGISEDNIELRQYITKAIREGYDDMPINALKSLGRSSEPREYSGYEMPPPKPRRLHKTYHPEDASQEFETQRSDYGDDLSVSQNGSDFFGAPKRPIRKGHHTSHSKYSMDSQDAPIADNRMQQQQQQQYFDDDEEYLRPPQKYEEYREQDDKLMNDLNFSGREVYVGEQQELDGAAPELPQPPRRRKRQARETSMEKDSYINGFSGRSVSNSYLQPPNDVIVYRTEHEYPVPLATPENYTDGVSTPSHKSRSISRNDDHMAERFTRSAESPDGSDYAKRTYESEDVVDTSEKFVIDMLENDGYAIVRKEHMPKPTPPARRKKFVRPSSERFATLPIMRQSRGSPPPERPPPPRSYTPTAIDELESSPLPPSRKAMQTASPIKNYDEDDYEEPAERAESPRNLQSGDIINKMKHRPLPPPPRPPREKRQRGESKSSTHEQDIGYIDDERLATSSTADSYDPNAEYTEDEIPFAEVEVSTQTDPLPDDFVCEEFEITEDMKIIEPRRPAKTLEELLREQQDSSSTAHAADSERLAAEDEQLSRGLQRFRDANQRSLSERSRASSQADRSKSLSRPQTPSAVVIEKRISSPISHEHGETMLAASLTVQPISDDIDEVDFAEQVQVEDEDEQQIADAAASTEAAAELEMEMDMSEVEVEEEMPIELDTLLQQTRSPVDSELETEGEYKQFVSDRANDYELEAADDEVKHYLSQSEDERTETGTEEEMERKTATETEADATSTSDIEKEIRELLRKYENERTSTDDLQQEPSFTPADAMSETETEIVAQVAKAETTAEPPQPPPRRKSTTVVETTPTLTIVEQQSTLRSSDVESQPTLQQTPIVATQVQLPSRVGDLEVERLRVHALQAGQIMVSQLHGSHISAEELECKSGNLMVQNIELPAGFIDDIVQRVRSSERGQLLAAETQTSLQASSEKLSIEQTSNAMPPPKPPRQKELELAAAAQTTDALQQLRNSDEQTQTDATAVPTIPLATAEYLQSLAPLAFYNLHRAAPEPHDMNEDVVRHRQHRHSHHHHHHHHRRRSSCSSIECEHGDEQMDGEQSAETKLDRRSRSRSCARSGTCSTQPQTVAQAGRKFIAACSLSLVSIINQLTDCIRGGGEGEKQEGAEMRTRQVPTLVVLFIVITFGLLIFLLSGKNVHTHHWDYFNPPGNEGRQT